MARNRYTRLVHDREDARLNEQERAMQSLAWELRRRPTGPVELPVLPDPKARRRIRLIQKQSRAPKHAVVVTPS